MDPPSLLLVAATIMVKKRLVNSITYFSFILQAAIAWLWQHGGGGGGGGSAAAVASMTVEAAAWQKRNFGGSDSVLGSAAAARRWRWQRGVGSGSMAYADNVYHGDGGDD
jgi:hypothetical protein